MSPPGARASYRVGTVKVPLIPTIESLTLRNRVPYTRLFRNHRHRHCSSILWHYGEVRTFQQ